MERSLNNIFFKYQRSHPINTKLFGENIRYVLFDKLEKVISVETETKNNKLIFNIKTKNYTLSIKTEPTYNYNNTEIYIINAKNFH